MRESVDRLLERESGYTGDWPEPQERAWTRSSNGKTLTWPMSGIFALIALILWLFVCVAAWGQIAEASVTEYQAIRAIVGEAENQGLEGMTAVAEAIRNRGSLRGVYGAKRDLSNTPKWVFEQAREAWRLSKSSDLVHGADHWESTDFKTPYWAKGAILAAHIGKHKFYKGVR